MTRKEKIIKYLRKELFEAWEKGMDAQEVGMPSFDMAYELTGRINVIADEILALPFDIPSDDEIEEWAREQFPVKESTNTITEAIIIAFRGGCSYGAKAALNDEIKHKEK